MGSQIVNTNGGSDFSSVYPVIVVNTSGQYEPNAGGGGGGTVQNGANLLGSPVFAQLNGSNLEFRGLSGVGSVVTTVNANTVFISGIPGISGPAVSTDTALVRWNGAGGNTVQNSDILLSATSIQSSYSGTINIGLLTRPFSGVYANQYGTTLLPQNPGGAATSVTLNWDFGSTQSINFNPGLSGNVFASLSNPVVGSTYTLKTIQNPSGTTNIYFPSSVLWQGGVSGVMTASGNAVDLFRFTYDGSNYLGSLSNNYR